MGGMSEVDLPCTRGQNKFNSFPFKDAEEFTFCKTNKKKNNRKMLLKKLIFKFSLNRTCCAKIIVWKVLYNYMFVHYNVAISRRKSRKRKS